MRAHWVKTMGLAALGLAIAMGSPVSAQSSSTEAFPSRPVRLIVPFPAGGATDSLARLLSQKLSQLWEQPVIVDNKPGAGTIIGVDMAAKAVPDGYTMAMVSTAHTINPSLHANLPFDPLKDLSGVTLLTADGIVLVAHPDVPAKNVAELVAYAKSKPGELTFASAGTGTSGHLAGELLQSSADISLTHVPYKGTAPAMTDLLAGRVSLMFDFLPPLQQHIKGGKLKALAVTDAKRKTQMPDVGTVAEAVPEYQVMSMFGIVTAAATPKELVRKLNADVLKVLDMPDIREKLAELGLTPVGSTSEAFDDYLRAEMEKWAKAVAASGATVN